MRSERPSGPISRIVGVYHMVLRRTLEHFFPDAILDVAGDRSIIDWDGSADETYYRLHDDSDGLGVEIEWLGTRLMFQPGNPSPLLATERRMVEVIVEAIDLRFRGLFNQELSHRFDRFQYQTEDLIVADYLDSISPYRIPAALEALRVAALSTYENRKVSTGALSARHRARSGRPGLQEHRRCPQLQGAAHRHQGLPSPLRRRAHPLPGRSPGRPGPPDRRRPLGRGHPGKRAARSSLPTPLRQPCQGHPLRRTRLPRPLSLPGDQGLRRRDLDVQLQRRSLATARYPQQVRSLVRGRRPMPAGASLAPAIFQAALNLCEARLGALFVVLRDPEHSVPQLIAPADQITAEIVADDPQDPENLSPKHAKRALHHVVRGMKLADIEPSVLEAIACLDGAVVVDLNGRLITFGAILRIAPETLELGRAVQGARTLAGLAASQHGPVLKVSEDGYITMFLKGRRVWELMTIDSIHFKCFSRNANVPLPLIVCGPTKNSIAHRSPMPSLASYRKLTLANS